MPFENIENMDNVIAGSTDADGYRLIWFVTGNEYPQHNYFPMEFKIINDNKLEFVKAYKSYDQDMAVCHWNGSVFLVNNASCRKIVINYEDNSSEEIDITDKLPFLYPISVIPKSYRFLDENGNEI